MTFPRTFAAAASVAAVLFSFAPAVLAADEVKPETPKACVEGLVAAMKKGDHEGMTKYLIEPYRSVIAKVLVSSQAMETADKRLATAVDAKFGEGTSKELNLGAGKTKPKVFQGDVEILDVKEEGETATVKTKETPTAKEGETPKPPKEETITCRKIGGFWYAEPPQRRARTPDQEEAEARMMEMMGTALGESAKELDQLAGDVEGGKVATKEEVKAKSGDIQMRFMQSMMRGASPGGPGGAPGGMGGGRKPKGDTPATATGTPAPEGTPAPAGAGK
jgi:hypothetical protein